MTHHWLRQRFHLEQKLSRNENLKMRKNADSGGVACGLCSISLQQATMGFGITDLVRKLCHVDLRYTQLTKIPQLFVFLLPVTWGVWGRSFDHPHHEERC